MAKLVSKHSSLIKDYKNNILSLVHDDEQLQEGFVPSVPGAGLIKSVVHPDDGENTMKEMYTTPSAMWLAPGGHDEAL